MAGPLQGIVVVEMASFVSGPFAGMLLSDLGAEVIKVELPGSGDPFRMWGAGNERQSTTFTAYNRGKKSVTIDLKPASGRDICERLVTKADVLIENFRPGVLERLGLGYEQLSKSNRRLIYCSISGMGSSGPEHKRPTYDGIAQAMSGLLSLLTDVRNPTPIGPALSDQITGLTAAFAISSALVGRGADGPGQKIDLSMLGATLSFLVGATTPYLLDGVVQTSESRPKSSQGYAFLASDGMPFVIHLSSPEKFWLSLVEAIGRPDLAEDSRFRTYRDRVENYTHLRETLGDVFATRTRNEWLAILDEHDVPSAPLHDIAEAIDHPQTRHLGLVQAYGDGPRSVNLVGFPALFSRSSLAAGGPPPRLGEHTYSVLRGLGYSDAEIERLGEATG